MSIRIAGELLREQEKEYEAKLAELTRLTALLEDRPKLAEVLRDFDFNYEGQSDDIAYYSALADRLIAYLKGVKS